MTVIHGKETMLYTDRIDRAIDRGVELLNAYTPHWFDMIDIRTFDIAICTSCIVGQVLPDYNWLPGLEKLGVGEEEPASMYGFDVDFEMETQDLQDAWVDRIEWMIEDADAANAYNG